MTTPPYVWLISGCSTGFGREIATSALEAGDIVAVTSRNIEDIRDICKKYPSTSIPLSLDVTCTDQIIRCVEKVISKFGSSIVSLFKYDLDENDGKTRVRYTYEGFSEMNDSYSNMNYSSGKYLESLRQFCQTGIGEAYGSSNYRS